MDPMLLAQKLDQDERAHQLPKAVVVVDLYGIPANFQIISQICERYGVPILEDSAEALGSTRDGKPCGTFGKISGFSFNGNKIITTSGGGALVADSREITDHVRFLATQAREKMPFYHHKTIGYNYRLSNLLAAVGCGQMTELPQRVQKRRAIFQRYVDNLRDVEALSWMPEPRGACSNKWLSVARINPEICKKSPEDIRLALEEKNIESRWTWKPMHMQPVYEPCECVGGKVCEDIFLHSICLPSGSSLSEADQDYVCDALRDALRN
jgi:pyridoxal phosphate-dependent aminotransferase EpsN